MLSRKIYVRCAGVITARLSCEPFHERHPEQRAERRGENNRKTSCILEMLPTRPGFALFRFAESMSPR
jgi:hypothetical protein